MTGQEATVRQVAFLLQMSNPELWDQTHFMISANWTKPGSLKGIIPVEHQVAGAPLWLKRGHRVPPWPLQKHCQSSWKCTKVKTPVAINPPLRKTGGCYTTAPLGPRSPGASSRWNLHRGTSVELSTYLSLLPCPFLCACRLLSAPTARRAGGTSRTKQPLWSPAKRAQNRAAAAVERATLSPNWKLKRRKEQRRRTLKKWLQQPRRRVSGVSLSSIKLLNNTNLLCANEKWLLLI